MEIKRKPGYQSDKIDFKTNCYERQRTLHNDQGIKQEEDITTVNIYDPT